MQVAIVAMGESRNAFLAESVAGCKPVADEVWAINDMAQFIRHDRVFMMDDFVETLGPDYDWIKTHDKPVYTVKEYDGYPTAVEYPLARVINSVGGYYPPNSTVAYALAYAIHKGVSKVSVYGADFTYPDMHRGESGRGCVEFYLHMAISRGIKIGLPPTTSLFDMNIKNKFYGYLNPIPYLTKEDGGIRVEMIDNPDFKSPFYGYKEMENAAKNNNSQS